jgi:hypothetical protein
MPAFDVIAVAGHATGVPAHSKLAAGASLTARDSLHAAVRPDQRERRQPHRLRSSHRGEPADLRHRGVPLRLELGGTLRGTLAKSNDSRAELGAFGLALRPCGLGLLWSSQAAVSRFAQRSACNANVLPDYRRAHIGGTDRGADHCGPDAAGRHKPANRPADRRALRGAECAPKRRSNGYPQLPSHHRRTQLPTHHRRTQLPTHHRRSQRRSHRGPHRRSHPGTHLHTHRRRPVRAVPAAACVQPYRAGLSQRTRPR